MWGLRKVSFQVNIGMHWLTIFAMLRDEIDLWYSIKVGQFKEFLQVKKHVKCLIATYELWYCIAFLSIYWAHKQGPYGRLTTGCWLLHLVQQRVAWVVCLQYWKGVILSVAVFFVHQCHSFSKFKLVGWTSCGDLAPLIHEGSFLMIDIFLAH